MDAADNPLLDKVYMPTGSLQHFGFFGGGPATDKQKNYLRALLRKHAGEPTAEAIRKVAVKLGILGTAGRAHAGRHMRNCLRYTRTQVAVIAANYKARKPAYKTVAARLALAA